MSGILGILIVIAIIWAILRAFRSSKLVLSEVFNKSVRCRWCFGFSTDLAFGVDEGAGSS